MALFFNDEDREAENQQKEVVNQQKQGDDYSELEHQATDWTPVSGIQSSELTKWQLTTQEIMEEFDITEEQAMEDLENINSKFDEEYSKELKKVQSITGGRYKIED